MLTIRLPRTVQDQPTVVTVDKRTAGPGAPGVKATRGPCASRQRTTGPRTRGMLMKAGLVVVGFAALTLGGAPPAQAGVALNTIDGHVTYDRDGARVRASGPIGCTRGERIGIRVKVSQAATAARARGVWTGRCTGEVQHWQMRARTGPEVRFAEGAARVCAVARTRVGHQVTDTRKWCKRVPLSAGF